MVHSGDVSPQDAWAGLSKSHDAQLIDVRTTAEWTFVGLPDLRPLDKAPILIEWQSYPEMTVNRSFSSALSAELGRRGCDKNAPLYFLCRSGARSRAAAEAMTASGYGACFNVAGGFEGDVDAHQRRGHVNGWKSVNLPWIQT